MKLWILLVVVVFPMINGYENENCKGQIEWVDNKERSNYRYPREWWKVDCQVKNRSVNATLWKSDEPMIVDGKRLRMINNVFNFTNITFADQENYFCEVCGEKKSLGKLRIIKDGGKAFQYPKIMNESSNSIEINAKVKLICAILGSYSLSWFINGEGAETTNVARSSAHRPIITCSLTINNFNRSYEGVYSCRATRQIGWVAEDKVRLELRAFFKPTFVNITGHVLSYREGQSMNLIIVATGYPPPEVKCNQENNSQSTNIKVQNEANSAISVRVSELKYSLHNGTSYHCTAMNANGSATWNFELNVLVKPKINMDLSGNKLISVSTKPMDLVCKVDEANPLAIVEWRYSYDNETAWSPVSSNLVFANIVGDTLRLNGQKEYKMFYKCVANNSLGEDTFTWQVLNGTNFMSRNQVVYSSSYITIVIVISSIVAVLLLCFVVVIYRRKKTLGGFYIFTLPPYRDYIKILDQNKFIHEQINMLPYLSAWEFPRENVVLQEELGSGAFGVVYCADAIGMTSFLSRRDALKDSKSLRRFSLTRFKKRNFSFGNNNCDVVKTAVKTLKADYSPNDLSDMLSELKVLIHVGEHENVLRILGACTRVKNGEIPLIILEYCLHGNLREFLREKRNIYEPEWMEMDNIRFSITDVANFALHVAKGMEFLISRKCIHRDLAARNVLINDRYIAKIADFGLARDVYNSLEYVKTTAGLLPIKWMAIEAIQDRVFNEKTDVWSYGIVLWEMFTLGGTPYPNLDPSLVLHTLLGGSRMSPPECCPEEMSDIMLSCWSKDPLERPSFSDIVCQIEKLCDFPNEVQEAPYQNVPWEEI